MSFNALWKQKKRALAKLHRFNFVAENCRRSVSGEPLLINRWTAFRKRLGAYFPPIHPSPRPAAVNSYQRLFQSGTKENDVARMALTVIICELVGLFFFITTAVKYSVFPGRLAVFISIGTQILTGLMVALPNLRAVVLIAIPELTTAKLKSVLLLFIISWSFQVSAMNAARNMQSLAESIACIRDSAVKVGNKIVDETNRRTNKYSLSAAKSEVGFFTTIVTKFYRKMKKLQNIIISYGRRAKEFLTEIVKIKERCQRLFVGPYYFCRRVFEGAARRCDEIDMLKLRFGCDLIESLKKICEVARFTAEVCVIPGAIRKSLKDGTLAYMKSSGKAAIDNALEAFRVKAVYRMIKNASREVKQTKETFTEIGIKVNYTQTVQQNLKAAEIRQIKTHLRDQMNFYKSCIKVISTVIHILIPVLILMPFISAIIYSYRFIYGENVDNFFITDEFRNVDLLREAQGQPTILPLMPDEKTKYIDGWTFHLLKGERARMITSLTTAFLGTIAPGFIILVDFFTYGMIYNSYDFLRSNRTGQDRPNYYKMKVAGEGIAAKLLQHLLKIYNPISENIGENATWRNCLDEPSPPDYALLQIILFLFCITLFLCVIGVYMGRLRRLIAEHYWPERKHARALFLYKNILEGRKNVLSQMLKASKNRECEEQLAEDEIAGRAGIVNKGLPILGIDQFQCVQCGRLDLSIKDSSNTRICPNCNDLYCTDCYSVRKVCMSCKGNLQAVMKKVEFYCDSSCEEEDLVAESNSPKTGSKTRTVTFMDIQGKLV